MQWSMVECALAAAMLGATFAEAAEPTSFRGVSLGQTHEQMQAAIPEGFSLKKGTVDGTTVYSIHDKSGDVCGSLFMDKGTTFKLTFSPCFFELDKSISDRRLSALLIKNYNIISLEVSEPKASEKGMGVSVVYEGETPSGEIVDVLEIFGSSIVRVENAPAGKF